MPFVSFIALSFNHSKFLIETLDSIVTQVGDFKYELIITDDASSDNSLQVINDWISKNNKLIEIKTVFNKTNLGLCTTLNKAIRLASGTWIKPIACDDVLENEYLTEWFKEVSKNDNIGLLCTDMSHIDSNSKFIRKSNWEYSNIQINPIVINDFTLLLKAQFLNTPTLIYKKSLWAEIGEYDESLIFEDRDFILRCKKVTHFGVINKSLVRYRIHGQNMHITHKLNPKYLKDSIKILTKHISENCQITNEIIRNRVLSDLSKLLLVDKNTAFKYLHSNHSWLTQKNKNAPLVSVLIAVFNASSYIIDAVNSILLQTYPNFEVIIIDDASTDDSLEKIKQFSDIRVKIFENTQNWGLAKSLNIGLSKCEGKYIVRMDADDLSYPDRIEKQVAFLEEHPDLSAVSSWMIEFNDEGKHSLTKYRSNPEEIKSTILFYSPVSHAASTFKSDVLKSLKYEEDFLIAQDYELWFRLLQKYNIGVMPEVLYLYRIHSLQSVSIRKVELKDNIMLRLIKNIHKYFNISESTELEQFHLNYIYKSEPLKDYDAFIRWNRYLKKFLNKDKSLFKDSYFINFVYVNYWREVFFKLYNDLKIIEVIGLMSSPFCKFNYFIKFKLIVKKIIYTLINKA